MKRSTLVALMVLHCLSAFPQAAFAPPADDHELYFGALSLVAAVNNRSLQEGTTEARAAIQTAFQKDIGVSAKDYAVLVDEAEALKPKIDQLRGAPNVRSARNQVIETALSNLRNRMTPGGLAGFQTFVNGKFRSSRLAFTVRH